MKNFFKKAAVAVMFMGASVAAKAQTTPGAQKGKEAKKPDVNMQVKQSGWKDTTRMVNGVLQHGKVFHYFAEGDNANPGVKKKPAGGKKKKPVVKNPNAPKVIYRYITRKEAYASEAKKVVEWEADQTPPPPPPSAPQSSPPVHDTTEINNEIEALKLVDLPEQTPIEVGLNYKRGLKQDEVYGTVQGAELTVRMNHGEKKKQRKKGFFHAFASTVAKIFVPFGKKKEVTERCPNGCIVLADGSVVDQMANVSLSEELNATATLFSKTKTEVVEAQIVGDKVTVLDGKVTDYDILKAKKDRDAAADKNKQNLPPLTDKQTAEGITSITPVGKVAMISDTAHAGNKTIITNKPDPKKPQTVLITRTYQDPIVSVFGRIGVGASYNIFSSMKDKNVNKVGAYTREMDPSKTVYSEDWRNQVEPYRVRAFLNAEAGVRVKLLENLYWETSVGVTEATSKNGILPLMNPYTKAVPDKGNVGRFGEQIRTGLVWRPGF